MRGAATEVNIFIWLFGSYPSHGYSGGYGNVHQGSYGSSYGAGYGGGYHNGYQGSMKGGMKGGLKGGFKGGFVGGYQGGHKGNKGSSTPYYYWTDRTELFIQDINEFDLNVLQYTEEYQFLYMCFFVITWIHRQQLRLLFCFHCYSMEANTAKYSN